MRVLVISDVHGNLAALEAVLAQPHDELVCLGDLVGYGLGEGVPPVAAVGSSGWPRRSPWWDGRNGPTRGVAASARLLRNGRAPA